MKRRGKQLSEPKIGHGGLIFFCFFGFLEISGLSIDLVLVLPGIIINTQMKRLNAWWVSLGVRY